MIGSLGGCPFAVIDVETTGFCAEGCDRVIEVAIVRVGPTGAVIDEYTTLVNPLRDVGPTPVHGITAEDVIDAPVFEDIAGDIASRLDGAVVAGHNVQFDLRFLQAELGRRGVAVPPLPTLCTLELAFRVCPELPSRKLRCCCEEAGVRHDGEHSALGDARATAALLSVYLHRAEALGCSCLADLGCPTAELPDSFWYRPLRSSGKTLSRAEASARSQLKKKYLAELVCRLPGLDSANPLSAKYMDLLDRVLEDRIITHAEAESVVGQALALGMTRQDVRSAHLAYLGSLVAQARCDGIVTGAEQRDLEAVCDMLGIDRQTLEVLLVGPPHPSAPLASSSGCLEGKTVCFTGELSSCLGGVRISREMAEDLATRAGLVVKPSVSKGLDLLVCADPQSQSGKAEKARNYCVRIMAEPAFWRAIGVRVE